MFIQAFLQTYQNQQQSPSLRRCERIQRILSRQRAALIKKAIIDPPKYETKKDVEETEKDVEETEKDVEETEKD